MSSSLAQVVGNNVVMPSGGKLQQLTAGTAGTDGVNKAQMDAADAVNAAAIAANTTNIGTNTTNIAANTTSIGTHTTQIAANTAAIAAGKLAAVKVVATTPYTLLTTDSLVHVTTNVARSVQLPDPALGLIFVLRDPTGTAATNTITLLRFGSEKINRVAASKVLATNDGSWVVYSDGTDYWVNGP